MEQHEGEARPRDGGGPAGGDDSDARHITRWTEVADALVELGKTTGEQAHGGLIAAKVLKALGVSNLFALSGGHIFPFFDGCKQEGIRIVDTRHEQNAVFAAEGWARLTRSLGVASVTAGPGVTNAMSPMAQAAFNRVPVLVLAGRAPQFRWGAGSLQEIDHVPFVDPIAPAATVSATADIAPAVLRAAQEAISPPRGPRFLDFPLDVVYGAADVGFELPEAPGPPLPNEDAAGRVAQLIESSERPILIAGSNVWLDHAESQLLRLVEDVGLPVVTNGQGRGCVPADHPLCFSRARGKAFKEADLVLVAGTPMDFRLNFGEFGGGPKLVHLDSHPDLIAAHVQPTESIGGLLDLTFSALADAVERAPEAKSWVEALREEESRKGQASEAELRSDARPIHPMRIYGELVPLLERDAIVIGDGGDFVSYAGKEVPSYEPGCWLDPGPFGCLGVGPGYALAARLAHPDRQIVLLLGDGALGFSGTELESLVRHDLPVTVVVGNNGCWGLEKHPMRGLYGYDVAADLSLDTRYDRMMEAFGGRGEMVEDPGEISSALRRAFDSGEPYLVNVITDPEVAYPRSSSLT